MASWFRWLGLIVISVLVIACGGGPSLLAEAAASLERAGSYKVDYRLTTFLEGTEKPVVGSGLIDFEGLSRWRTRQGPAEIVAEGSTIYVRTGKAFRVEEMVELPIHPLLYLQAAVDIKRTGEDEASRAFSFVVDREQYRKSLRQALGRIPIALVVVLDRFDGSGEVTLDAGGRPLSMRLHLRDSSSVRRNTRQELELLFLKPGDCSPQASATTLPSQPAGETYDKE